MTLTATEVFDFIGAASDVRSEYLDMINFLILSETNELESLINRSISRVSATNLILTDGVNCKIFGNKIFFMGNIRDMYSISQLTHKDEVLSQLSAYNDSNGYYFYPAMGMITIPNVLWSHSYNAIKINCQYGYTNSDGSMRYDIKEILKEMVAVKSKLWTLSINDQRILQSDFSDDLKKRIERLEII